MNILPLLSRWLGQHIGLGSALIDSHTWKKEFDIMYQVSEIEKCFKYFHETALVVNLLFQMQSSIQQFSICNFKCMEPIQRYEADYPFPYSITWLTTAGLCTSGRMLVVWLGSGGWGCLPPCWGIPPPPAGPVGRNGCNPNTLLPGGKKTEWLKGATCVTTSNFANNVKHFSSYSTQVH